MNAVFSILFVQALMGAFDNFWHHEIKAKLPQRFSARYELALHSAREAIYAFLFAAFAWLRWEGAWVLVPTVLLAVEIAITCADFLEEDRTRRLPSAERVLHTLLAVSFGVLVGVVAPVFIAWGQRPTSLQIADHGAMSWLFTFFAFAVLAWGARDAWAVARLRITPLAPMSRGTGPAVLVTGATGFIGSRLVHKLLDEGRRVIVLSRDVAQARSTFGAGVWVVDRLCDIPDETRIGAVVHLAGAPVLGMPWTRKRRDQLVASRTLIMRDLLGLMRRLKDRPEALVSASAVGYYGVPTLGRALGDDGPPQPGRFQSDLCAAIEHEARRAETLGVRVVRMRFGLVLGHGGGSYPPLAFAARFGLGARLGSGRQPVPWIHVDDAIALVKFALGTAHVRGAVNAVAPEIIPQAKFTRELARSLGRRAFLRVPGWLLRTAMGEMSELLLEGQPVMPRAAMASGFAFRFSHLSDAAADLAAR
jgi:uncharacterized protein (TIGR01777 family)